MVFLGYGIIELPRKFYMHTSLQKSIDYEYYRIQQKDDIWEEVKYKLEEYVAAVLYLEDKVEGLRQYHTQIMEIIPEKFI